MTGVILSTCLNQEDEHTYHYTNGLQAPNDRFQIYCLKYEQYLAWMLLGYPPRFTVLNQYTDNTNSTNSVGATLLNQGSVGISREKNSLLQSVPLGWSGRFMSVITVTFLNQKWVSVILSTQYTDNTNSDV